MIMENFREPPPSPLRLRPTKGGSIGTTAFFRNRALLSTICELISKKDIKSLNILFHACSIGAEPYSFLMTAKLHPVVKNIDINLYATDIEGEFLEYARNGIYDRNILNGMTEEERRFFICIDNEKVKISDEIKGKTCFLPPESCISFKTEMNFDIVFMTNVLIYVDGQSQGEALRQVASYNSRLLIVTGFHFDRIESDLTSIGYTPIDDNIEDIHNGWTDRRVDVDDLLLIPGVNFHHWNLPAFSRIPGYEYIYCAIFEKNDGRRLQP